jgi:hypothetical protein
LAAGYGVALLGVLSAWVYEIILEKLGHTEEEYRGLQLLICPLPVIAILYTINPNELGGAVFISFTLGNLGVAVGPAFRILLNPLLIKIQVAYDKSEKALDDWMRREE